ncbi:MAG TPA: exosortase/archaeosortase family protein [Pirellulales bacterium]|jgi:exosortase|nr:exosortase/archaeosortase family protein [Pirellulales bacterium]
MAQAQVNGRRLDLAPLAALSVLLVTLLWGYWNSLLTAARYWDNPKYSHGYMVPLFTLILLWLRRDTTVPIDRRVAYVGGALLAVATGLMVGAAYLDIPLPQASLMEMLGIQAGVVGALLVIQQPFPSQVAPSARAAGIGLLSLGLGIRLLATFFPNLTPEMYSFVPAILGTFILVGGWKFLVWAGPPLGFLIFMFPLPSFLDAGLLGPLQRLATDCSTYCLQTLGIAAVNEGNRIGLGEVNLDIVEACSGLRMLTIFGAIAVAITMVTDRPWWEKMIIVASAVPIALAVNIIRITATGIMYVSPWVGPEMADRVFHDMYGWFMMPVALGMLYVEFQVLAHLFLEEDLTAPVAIGTGANRAGQRAGVVSR